MIQNKFYKWVVLQNNFNARVFCPLDFRVIVRMPPKRNHDNVDVDDEGDRDGDSDEVGEIKTIWIVNLNSENREKFMCEMCSSLLQSAAALARHKLKRCIPTV